MVARQMVVLSLEAPVSDETASQVCWLAVKKMRAVTATKIGSQCSQRLYSLMLQHFLFLNINLNPKSVRKRRADIAIVKQR